MFDNRLIFPPLPALRRVLECGFGSASWAIDVAEQFPSCEVRCAPLNDSRDLCTLRSAREVTPVVRSEDMESLALELLSVDGSLQAHNDRGTQQWGLASTAVVPCSFFGAGSCGHATHHWPPQHNDLPKHGCLRGLYLTRYRTGCRDRHIPKHGTRGLATESKPSGGRPEQSVRTPHSQHPRRGRLTTSRSTFPTNHFDLVNSRLMAGGIHANRWRNYMADMFRVLRPGGWCQMVEIYFNAQSDNGTLTDSRSSSADGLKRLNSVR